jgi:hypothetical protein
MFIIDLFVMLNFLSIKQTCQLFIYDFVLHNFMRVPYKIKKKNTYQLKAVLKRVCYYCPKNIIMK